MTLVTKGQCVPSLVRPINLALSAKKRITTRLVAVLPADWQNIKTPGSWSWNPGMESTVNSTQGRRARSEHGRCYGIWSNFGYKNLILLWLHSYAYHISIYWTMYYYMHHIYIYIYTLRECWSFGRIFSHVGQQWLFRHDRAGKISAPFWSAVAS